MKVSLLGFIFSSICLFAILESCQTKNKEDNKEIPLLIFTDFGRDIDDAEAFIYLAKNPGLKIVGVVCNSYIPEVRADGLSSFLKLMGCEPPISIGSTFPIGIKDSLLIEQYLLEHSIHGISYEMSLRDSLKCWNKHVKEFNFESSEELISRLLIQYSRELRIVILSQATDAAMYFSSYPEKIKDVYSFYIQGQAQITSSDRLIPDSTSYNLKEDIKAAELIFSLQDSIPFTLLGKYAAYPLVYTQKEILLMTEGEDKVKKYLYYAANMGLECFLKRDSVTFYRVFNIDSSLQVKDALEYTDKMSNPYDLLTVIAITHPELFKVEKIGKHSLIGMSSHESALRDSVALKKLLLRLTE